MFDLGESDQSRTEATQETQRIEQVALAGPVSLVRSGLFTTDFVLEDRSENATILNPA